MPDTVLTRRHLIAGGTGLTAGSIAALASSAPAAAGTFGRLSADDIVAIYNLKAGYALGSDALAADRVDEGLARYRAVFTDNAHVTSLPAIDVVGPDQLAERVYELVAGAVMTQHLLGTIEVVPKGRDRRRKRADVIAYVQATIVLPDGGLQRVLARYDDVAVETSAGWRLESSAATTLHVEVVPPAG